MQIYGFHPVREALRHSAREVRRVLIVAGRSGKRRQQIEGLCGRSGIPVFEVRESDLDSQSRGVHNGFVAEMGSGEPERLRGGGDRDLLVLVEDIQDPRNLGAIVRVCDGAGVGRVLIRDRGSAQLTPTVTKASAGATELVEIERITNSANEIAQLRKDGFWIYGADAAGRPPWEIDLTGKVAFCLGGEESGLRRRTRSLCDELVGLPMRGGVESLNVSAAAAALLYEAVRQRT